MVAGALDTFAGLATASSCLIRSVALVVRVHFLT